jgi:predicted RNA-binding protein with PUA-like domain
MNKQQRRTSNVVRRNWQRSNRLAELAGIRPVQARAFIKAADHGDVLLLDAADCRNPRLREFVKRAANGHADAPETPTLKPENQPAAPAATATPAATPADDDATQVALLFELKALLARYGSAERIHDALGTLMRLLEPTDAG